MINYTPSLMNEAINSINDAINLRYKTLNKKFVLFYNLETDNWVKYSYRKVDDTLIPYAFIL